MADDKKKIVPEVETLNVAPATEHSCPKPVLTGEEAAILEQEGQAAFLEMGEFIPDKPEPIVGDPTPFEQAESSGATKLEAPTPTEETKQADIPDMDAPALRPLARW